MRQLAKREPASSATEETDKRFDMRVMIIRLSDRQSVGGLVMSLLRNSLFANRSRTDRFRQAGYLGTNRFFN